MITMRSSREEWDKAVKAFIALEKEIKDYGNGIFVTVNYFTGCGENEHSAFKLVLARDGYRKSFWSGTQVKNSVTLEFGLHEVETCRKTWLKIRDIDFKATQKWETPWWASNLAWNG